nr:MAG TPA: hypothetical protein [Caudoviricetes sp.]
MKSGMFPVRKTKTYRYPNRTPKLKRKSYW